MREILFVAGEVSGDLHASGVARELAARHSGTPEAFRLVGVGGDAMRAAGVELIEHVGKLAVMGFIDVVPHLFAHGLLLRELTRRISSGDVALVVLIDYPTFNMKVAEAATAAGVPVLYYITPQVWAWGSNRLERLARTVTKAAVILPFEEDLLRRHAIDATFVGHPLLDRAEQLPTRAMARKTLGLGDDDRVLALFPGSRNQEIDRHLDVFVGTARELQQRDPTLRVIVGAAPHVTIDPARCPFPMVRSASFAVLRAADAALCKSGTTTLEAAVAGCPLVLAYRAGPLDYLLAKYVMRVKIPHIGLVNVVAGRQVAPEFVQDALEARPVADALAPLLNPASAERRTMLDDLDAVRAALGTPGAAARVAAMAITLAQRAAGRKGGGEGERHAN